jgi:hypothetical protein
MRDFLQFLTEQQLPSMRNSAFTGFFSLPDLDNSETETPMGGYKNYSQVSQEILQQRRMSGKYGNLYANKKTLVKFRNLAEEAISAVKLRPDVQDTERHMQMAYPNVKYKSAYKVLSGFTESELIGGIYPRLRPSDVDFGVQHGILQVSQTPEGKRYNLIIETLRSIMINLASQLKEVEKKERGFLYGAQKADELLPRLDPYLWKDSGIPRLDTAR